MGSLQRAEGVASGHYPAGGWEDHQQVLGGLIWRLVVLMRSPGHCLSICPPIPLSTYPPIHPSCTHPSKMSTCPPICSI
jgi:hypothetical protein